MTKNRLIVLIAFALFVIGIGNGAVTYLKRVGLLEPQTYASYRASYCLDDAGPCLCKRSLEQEAAGTAEPPKSDYIYQNIGNERWFKGAKDLLFAVFTILSIVMIWRRLLPPPPLADSWVAAPLAASVALGIAISLVLWGALFAALGLRSFAFLAVMALGGWMTGGMHHFSRSVTFLLAIEMALLLPEFLLGVPLHACPRWFRAAGTFVLPNTLGVFAAVALAFHVSFSGRRNTVLPWLMAAVLIVASASGTGLVALCALAAALVVERAGPSHRLLTGVVMLVLVVVVAMQLPRLTQRDDIHESLLASGGRIGKLEELLRSTSGAGLVFGRGVGFGTNTAFTVSSDAPRPLPAEPGSTEPFSADSTVIVLLTQLGAIGIVSFYGLLGWAFRRDRIARPLYIVVAIASLTINITELFPVNFLLGLALAHSIAVSSRIGVTNESGAA